MANKHLSWPQVLAHFNTVHRLVEEERSEQRGPQVAILYEELARRHLEKRAHKSDPTLDVLVFFAEPGKSLLAAARQRVSALRNRQTPGKTSSATGSVSKALANSHRDEALQAARALQTQQQERGRDARSMQNDLP